MDGMMDTAGKEWQGRIDEERNDSLQMNTNRRLIIGWEIAERE